MINKYCAVVLTAFIFALFKCDDSFAATKVVTTKTNYSIGFFLSENSCDIAKIEDSVSALFTVIEQRKGSKVAYAIVRQGKLPVVTKLAIKTITSKGFQALGSGTAGVKLYDETLKVNIRGKKGTALLTMKITDGGETCRYVYEGTVRIR